MVVDRDRTLGFAVSDTQGNYLRSSLMELANNESSNIDWSRKVHVCGSIVSENVLPVLIISRM